MRRSRRIAPLVALVAALALAGLAVAGVPGATTGDASDVTDTTAMLNGVAHPNKEETTVHFEYGTSPSYGAQTPAQAIGGGNAGKDVSAALTGLAPGTTYHFRLVSTNASGTDHGQDKTFTTLGSSAAPPGANAVTIAAAPAKVRFGRSTVISGQVSGQKAAGAEVTLEQTPAPFSNPFTPVGTPVAADAAGAYSITAAPTVNTRYQVTAKTSPPVTSGQLQVNVAPAVGFRVGDSRVRRGRRVRFSGAVRPPSPDGTVARIQRRTSKGFRTVAQVTLRNSTEKPDRSVYRRRLRIRRTSTYRVRVPADADHVAGKSRKRRIRVR